MIKNISISTFINTIFAFAFICIFLTLATFVSYDKQRYELSLQSRYELIAENFLILFQDHPTTQRLEKLYKKFNVKPIEDRDRKLDIINNAQELAIRQNYLGTYRVYKFDEIYYIYVQQYGYNVMLKDIKYHSHNAAFIIVGFAIALLVFLFLYEILNRKLQPLKTLNKQITEFSNGNRDIQLDYVSNDEIGAIARNFNEAINTINNQSKSKDLFMRNMMHELKTPIAKAMFIAETLDDEKTRNNLQKAFKRMDDIIKELATVEKLTSQNTIIYKESVFFSQVLNRAIEIMMICPNKIEQHVEDFVFEADIYMLSVALKNLLDNAIKFSIDKKAVIKAKDGYIAIISEGEPLKYSLDYYTEAFSQEDKRSNGFGLGLYIVKTIINLHKFKLEYNYNDGKNHFIINLNSN